MDLLYPRICQVIYGDANYDNYEGYNYYNELDDVNQLSNSDYLDYDNETDDEIELIWRYSSKNKKNDNKRPILKKSYTTIENYNNNTDNLLAHKFVYASHKHSSAPVFTKIINNPPQSTDDSQFSPNHENTSLSNINISSNKQNALGNSADLLKSRSRQAASALLTKRNKPEYYLEYINFINNPSMQPKYFTEAVKHTSPGKKICEKYLRSAGSNSFLQSLQNRNHSYASDGHGSARHHHHHHHNQQNQLRKRNENLQKENEKTKQFESTSYDSLNKLKPIKKEREKMPKLSTLIPPQKSNLPFKPKLTVIDTDVTLSNKPKIPPVSKANTLINDDINDLESEERDLFYTDVDIVIGNRRQHPPFSNNNSRLSERSPDIYTEIVKMPNHIEELSDDEYHKLEHDLGVKEIDEHSRSSLGSSLDENDEQKTLKDENPVGENSDQSAASSRPAAAGRERKRVVSFEAVVVTNNDEEEEGELFATESEVLVDKEIVKRKKLSKDALKEAESLGDDDSLEPLNLPAEATEVKIEKSKTPELPQAEEEDEHYEIKVPLPDFGTRKESVTILKPSNKSLIRLVPPVEKKPVEEKKRRERIDVNSLRPKFTKRVQFYEPEEEDIEEEIIVNSDDWLAKWCIFKEGQRKKFEQIFEEYDYMDKGYMNGENLIYALERAFPLNNLKMTYLMRVMGLLDVDPFKFGTNKKTFCVIAALAQRIQHLDDDWFKNLLPKLDIKSVENKVFKVKTLWDFLVDKDSKLVKLNDLMIEMRAGGVTDEHIKYAEEKFSDKTSFDLLDYLTYIPLFVHIHEKIVLDPFNEKDKI